MVNFLAPLNLYSNIQSHCHVHVLIDQLNNNQETRPKNLFFLIVSRKILIEFYLQLLVTTVKGYSDCIYAWKVMKSTAFMATK